MPTIAAIATPPGDGGIGIVRVSGPGALGCLEKIFIPFSTRGGFAPWRLRHGKLLDSAGEPLDDALAVFMPAPRSFTGEDVAEIHCHGGRYLVESALESVLAAGARRAQRGEFTRRAFLNGRIDLSQAEAVAELIAAPSREAARYSLKRLEGALGQATRSLRARLDEIRARIAAGLDFPDDEVEIFANGDLEFSIESLRADILKLASGAERAAFMQNGAIIALVGPVNAGKSSILNVLSGRRRAIVTPVPGTTRDFIEENINLDGLPVRLVDTAGLRGAAADPVELLGMEETRRILATANLALMVFDASAGEPDAALVNEMLAQSPAAAHIFVFNKIDLASAPAILTDLPVCAVSAVSGENIAVLASVARDMILAGAPALPEDNALAPNRRQALALKEAAGELGLLLQDSRDGVSFDCLVSRLDSAAAQLEEITGIAGHDQLLDMIFSQFCIGK